MIHSITCGICPGTLHQEWSDRGDISRKYRDPSRLGVLPVGDIVDSDREGSGSDGASGALDMATSMSFMSASERSFAAFRESPPDVSSL